MAGEPHLLFVPARQGYELIEREGAPPPLGSKVDLEGRRFVVLKVAFSPLPDDERRCAYLLEAR